LMGPASASPVLFYFFSVDIFLPSRVGEKKKEREKENRSGATTFSVHKSYRL